MGHYRSREDTIQLGTIRQSTHTVCRAPRLYAASLQGSVWATSGSRSILPLRGRGGQHPGPSRCPICIHAFICIPTPLFLPILYNPFVPTCATPLFLPVQPLCSYLYNPFVPTCTTPLFLPVEEHNCPIQPLELFVNVRGLEMVGEIL